MEVTRALIEKAYAAFNRRDIDGALALMTEDVNWPKASEGGRVVGKEEIRAYWTRQWGEFDGLVEPLAITEEDGGKVRVRVHQLVKNLQGDVLSDSEVLHVFTMNSCPIAAMDLGDEADSAAGPGPPHSHDPNRLRSSSRPFLTAGTLGDRLGASAALFNESYLDSRLGHIFWGRLQGQVCTAISQVSDSKRVGSANGNRTRIRRPLLFPISY